MNLLIFILASAGLTLIVTQGEIFCPVRAWMKERSTFLGKLIECPMCFGVYAGWFVEAVILYYTGERPHLYHGIYGFISSFCSYCGIVIINTVEVLYNYLEKKQG